MNYNDFIDELKPLLEEARTLFDVSEIHQNPQFRKWRHQLTTTIGIIQNQDYWIDCDIESRTFQVASYDSISKREQIAYYNQELQDTINELEIIIQHFQKYGDPRTHKNDNQADTSINTPSKQAMTDSSQTKKSAREKFESHPLIWGLTLITIGFGSGFAVRPYLLPEAQSSQPQTVVNCTVEGVDTLEEAHNARMETLQVQLMKLEANASNHDLIGSYQRKYKETADRVRQDIKTENTSYKEAMLQLSKLCQ